MVKDLIGYRFSPTGEELINHYLKNKNLGTKTWLVDEAISEINILSHKPSKDLPKLAKIQSEDLEWYFFSPIEYTNRKKNEMKRTTGTGFWKPTGVDRKIKDKRGNGVVIGFKKTLVYHEGKGPNGVRTPWAMHEYHITCLPHDKRKYVICQVKYKGEAADISYEPSHSLDSDSNATRAINRAAEPEHQVEQPGRENFLGMSLDDLEQEDPNTYLQPQGPHLALNDDEFIRGLRHVDRGPVEYLFANEENIDGLSMNDLRTPMIVQEEDLSEWDGFDADTFFSDNNNNYNLNVHQLTRYGDDYRNAGYNGGNFEGVHPDQELIMQENRNDHMPKKPLTGTIDYSSDSDSDAGSISTTSYQGISSPNISVGSSSRRLSSCSSTDSCKDLQTSADPSIGRETREYQLTQRTVQSVQEVKQETPRAVDASINNESSLVKTEKKGLFIVEDAMEKSRKAPRFIYLMIIGFIRRISFTTRQSLNPLKKF
ncbi:NAC domain superfamily [Arabidopsis suecica]|uniref:NAC domain superfamily n=1 Tax=Arabidopsis suecica TaxID=45249 RepID=A0A8T1ZID8_ARASU|nr:NAC domain superfamily [Arabidopsis suecica]